MRFSIASAIPYLKYLIPSLVERPNSLAFTGSQPLRDLPLASSTTANAIFSEPISITGAILIQLNGGTPTLNGVTAGQWQSLLTHNRSLIPYAGCEMGNSLDPTRGARCCREWVLLRPFPTQGQFAQRPNPAVNWTCSKSHAVRLLG